MLRGQRLIIFIISLLLLQGSVFAKINSNRIYTAANTGQQELTNKLTLAKSNYRFIQEVKKQAEIAKSEAKFREKINKISVGEKIAAFLKVKNNSPIASEFRAKLQKLESHRLSAPAKATSGSLSGLVTVDGAVTFDPIEVIAFDTRGFYAGSASVDFSGNYAIAGLAGGQYYVVTSSAFVDEFYDNVVLSDFKSWRDADLVTVPENGVKTDVNFDLKSGASIAGKIFGPEGTIPLPFQSIDFTVFSLDNPDKIHQIFGKTTDAQGAYQINVPFTGNVKLQASSFDLASNFYNNKPDFDSADIISIASFEDVKTDINFNMELSDDSQEGAVITGTIIAPSGDPAVISLVVAVDIADTSIAALGIQFFGDYSITGLHSGTYILYAISYTGPALLTGYYDNAQTLTDATRLTLGENQTLTEINITLNPNGAIAGKITDDTGAELDSVIVLAIKKTDFTIDNLFDSNVWNLIRIDYGLSFSDTNGVYTVSGLSTGDYILRTISLLRSGVPVIDEYYGNVQSIFDLDAAEPVHVDFPNTRQDINFVLERAGAISGHFYEADGGAVVQGDAIAVAFNADTGLPELAIPSYNSEDGSYTIGPLPSGNFKLVGIVGATDILGGDEGDGAGNTDPVIYLPQFYDGKADLATADPVAVQAPNTRQPVDFKMVRAGTIEGVVEFAANEPVGADKLSETIVLAYNANTGLLAGTANVTFAGGFQITGLTEGSYKIQALTGENEFAATYYGGGATFTDGNSEGVGVTPGSVVTANIRLGTGLGVIRGNVKDLTGAAVNNVLVLAYDATGHVVSAGVSGFADASEVPGQYAIPGLRTGNYYIRTFSLFQILARLEDTNLEGVSLDLTNVLELLLGLIASSGDLLEDPASALDFQLYSDVWYRNEVITIDINGDDIFSLAFTLLSGSGDPQLIIPFYSSVPGGANTVAVLSPGLTDNIDLQLPAFINPLTGVSDNSGAGPAEFNLAQNYPNPFNPTTVISYDVAQKADISLQIYNILGQKIRTLFDGYKDAGSYITKWNGLNDAGEQVAAGIYFVRMKTENLMLTRKMTLVK